MARSLLQRLTQGHCVFATSTSIRLLNTIEAGDDQFLSSTFDPDGKSIVVGSNRGTATVWDAQLRKVIGTPLRLSTGIISIAFSQDRSRIITSTIDGKIQIWDKQTDQLTAVQDKDRLAALISMKPGTFLLKSNDNSAPTAARPVEVQCVAFSPDGKMIATTSLESSRRLSVRIVDTNDAVLEMGTLAAIESMAFSPDSSHLVIGLDDGQVQIIELKGDRKITTLGNHELGVNSASYSPDGNRIVRLRTTEPFGSGDSNTRGVLATFQDANDIPVRFDDQGNAREIGVASANFSPSGKEIVVTSEVATRIWYVEQVTKPISKIVEELCSSELAGVTILSPPAEMRLIGAADNQPPIDVCKATSE